MDESDENSSIITLDQIDRYLSKNNYLTNNNLVDTLWNNDKYYEFDVVADRVSEETDYFDSIFTDKLSNVNKYNCPICNIDVPVAYTKDHNDSVKHKICLKLTDLVLERTRLHVKQHNEVPNLKIQLKNTYFCEACAAVVQIVDKSKHEQSEAHVISVKHDELLNNLLLVYTDRSNVKIDFKDEKTAEIAVKNDNTIETELYNVKKEVSNNTKPQLNANDVDNCLKTYINTLREKYSELAELDSLTVVNNDCIQITALNGEKVVVSADNFHGFNKLEDNIQCKLCKVLIDGPPETHKFTETHMDRVTLPFTDEHCIRLINNWNHCLLCNELFFDVGLHTQNKNHKSLLEDAKDNLNSEGYQIVGKKKNRRSRKKMTYCTSCHMCMDRHSFEAHLHTSGHKLYYKEQTIPSSNSKVTEQIPQENIHYLISQTADSQVCICYVCKTKITRKQIVKHLKGSAHNVNFNMFLSFNNIKLLDNQFHCEICNVFMSKFDLTKHVDMENHISFLNQFESLETAVASSSEVIDDPSPHTDVVLAVHKNYCNICKVSVPSKGVEIHNKGNQHKNKVLELSKLQQAPEKDNGQLSTKFNVQSLGKANVQPLGKANVQPLGKTNEQPPRKANVKSPANVDVQSPAKVNVKSPANVDVQSPAKVNVQSPAKVNVQSPTKVNVQSPAKVNVQSPAKVNAQSPAKVNEQSPAKVNVQSPAKANVQSPAKVNAQSPAKVNKQSPAKVNVQSPAKVNVQPPEKVNVQPPGKNNVQPLAKDNVQPHEKANVHAPGKANVQPPGKTNVQIPGKSNVQPPAKVKVKPPAKVNGQAPAQLSHYLMQKCDIPHSFLCIVCNVQVPKTAENIRIHVKGSSHGFNYDKIISTNKLIKRDNMQYYCEFCETDLEHEQEIAHVDDISHKINTYISHNEYGSAPEVFFEVDLPSNM